MNIFPAIDLIDGCAVRLVKGDYNQKTVYSTHPEQVACDFRAAGAEFIHLVDLDGAKSGNAPNFETVKSIVSASGLHAEIGGGIRSMAVIERYLSAGVSRVILGTAAVKDPEFLRSAVSHFGEQIAVGVDIRDGFVAVNGWTELSRKTCMEFCDELEQLGVKTVICTDISKDGMLGGTNTALYRTLSEKFSMDFIASGGVSTLQDIQALRDMGLYGAIIGKAYYTGAIDLKDAIEVAKA